MSVSHPDAPPPSILDAALDYRSRGWCIIPTIKKKAAGRWKQFQTDPPDEKVLQRLFANSRVDGLAVVLGSASQGLACRDFDKEDSYDQWASRNPALARELPTVVTARGHHT